MATDALPRFPLTSEERGAALAHLDSIQARLESLHELLYITAARHQTHVSAWADARLSDIETTTTALVRAIEKAPRADG